MHRFSGLAVDAADFSVDEVMISLRAPPPVQGDPRVRQKQTPIRPSLIVHRRATGNVATLELLAGEVIAELVSSITGLSKLTNETFTYADGTTGLCIGFDFPAAEVGTARQYHALRLDKTDAEGVLTTLTLTIDALTLTDAGKEKWLALLSSCALDGKGTLS